MTTDLESNAVALDRRQVYRPFLERLNPMASLRDLAGREMIVPQDHDPRDAVQPPIHVAFADAAELSRGTQMALVGGIGSGKTTELLLIRNSRSRTQSRGNCSSTARSLSTSVANASFSPFILHLPRYCPNAHDRFLGYDAVPARLKTRCGGPEYSLGISA